ncbi:HAAS signaling domain-containing protein [uncultured Clostridium sp.]|uniref:HAAS signaling domain-containing protein n=1 Tax=uncultured Clostridium sp. TaxID=59620 RepID=UPI0025E8ADEC|nr:DUF1700 domain-containing protein [uncultured Clostridium sp.]
MTQHEFFDILMDELKELPELKLQEIISFYENKILSETSLGKSEDEIIESFGNPHLIGLKYKNNEFNNEAFNYQKDVCSPINSNNNTLDINSINNLNNQQNNITYIQPITVTDENTSEFKKHEENSIYSSPYVNKILKICILILGLIIFSPIFTSIAGMLMGLLGIALSILFGSIGLLIGGTFTSLVNSPEIPQFIANFPYPVLILFSLGSICISILLGIIFYYSCKFFLKLFLRLFRFFKSKV